MRVPNLEDLVTQGEQEALPESRLKALIEAHPNRSMGDVRLLTLCRKVYDYEPQTSEWQSVLAASRRGGPTDEGYKLYHRIVSVLAGLYPGLGAWYKGDILDALGKVMEAGL